MSSSHTIPEFDQANITQSGPQRKCIITGQVADKADLIRFVASPDGQLVADTGNKLGAAVSGSVLYAQPLSRRCQETGSADI